ncbi:MAG: hypothetical protein ACR2OC_02290 [Solirubrobacterales bacterium]
MSAVEDIRARERARADRLLIEVTENAVGAEIAVRYAAVPSWYADGRWRGPGSRFAAVPSWSMLGARR